MFSEYLLSDNFEKGDGGFSSRGGPPEGSGCLVLIAVLVSMFAVGIGGVVLAAMVL